MQTEKKTFENPIWPRPALTPVPVKWSALNEPVLSLTGVWKFTMSAPQNYWENSVNPEQWDDVPVPAELFALGYDIRRNKEYVYKKQIQIPAEWVGMTVILKIGMAYDYSKIWVDGNYVRDHKGGFTSFECDVSKYLIPGKPVWLTVMCMHRNDCLVDWPLRNDPLAKGYSGLIDEIKLVAVPKTHLTRLFYTTDFDEKYTDAVLNITAVCTGFCSLDFNLIDPSGAEVFLNTPPITLNVDNPQQTAALQVASPLKWDAEHPSLYKLNVHASSGDGIQLHYSVMVGFRKVERIGNELYVNGVRTKLRGVALYGHDPILGKVFTRHQFEEIIKAAKWANINYLRSSAYPERECLYDLCDRYGIFVEECAPANFQRGAWDSQKDMVTRHTSDIPLYKADYMEQFAEMIERDRNHPSIIIWEYANESDWGVNFQSELDYLAVEDPTRLTAGTWDNTKTSLASYHYPDYNEVFSNAGIYDEYTHVATHAVKTLKRDPGIRNAWGLSIQKGWDALYIADGVVGAAIFAMGDYTIQRPEGDVFAAAFGQWGLIDSWNREKPELWLTKKAYSPVKLPEKEIANPGESKALLIPVGNRYNNTNLCEVTFRWSVGDESHEMNGPEVAPGKSGCLELPDRAWTDGDILHITVLGSDGVMVDEYQIVIGKIKPPMFISESPDSPPTVTEKDGSIIVEGKDYRIAFSKTTGLIQHGSYKDEALLESGPYLNLYGAYYKPSIFQNDRKGEFGIVPSGWQCGSINYRIEGNEAIIDISGFYPEGTHKDMWGFEYGYAPINVSFEVRLDGEGIIKTAYQIKNPPKEVIFEAGIAYILSDKIDRLIWERCAQYSAYPEDHIGRPKGTAHRYRGYGQDNYREKPAWPWSADETNYTIYGGKDPGGHGTNDFISTRENIWFASALLADSQCGVRVESDGASVSVRVCPAQDEDPALPLGIKLTVNNLLYYDLGNGSNPNKTGDGYLGNYTYGEIRLDCGYSGSVQMRLITKS
jgi:hypothetical protein